jgi:hypothetical protein
MNENMHRAKSQPGFFTDEKITLPRQESNHAALVAHPAV